MNTISSSQYTLLTTTRYALLVMLFCYIPHFSTAPWWLFLLVSAAIGYRISADYFGYPRLNQWIRFIVVVMCLFLLKIHYGSILSSGFFIGFLLIFIGLKSIEIHHFRDLKVLIICNFYLIFSALIIIQEFWIIPYLFLAVLANFSLMLKLNAPHASLRQLGGKSIKQLLIALPLSLILFYIFPRIADPLWRVPSLSQSHIGFSETMNPGSIADLFSDDSIALRITFKDKPVLNGYWRGLILTFYNGISWNPTWHSADNFSPLPKLSFDKKADYEIILEPHQKKWLFYLGYPLTGRPALLFAPNNGLISKHISSINQRFAYALTIQSKPYQTLSPEEKQQNTKLPRYLNPQLKAWAKEQFRSVNHDPGALITFLRHYIKQQPFWYTLTPPDISADKNQMDFFWFTSQEGFCEHYASAVTIILRAAGIPARIIVGYQRGTWNPLAQYLTIQQNNAHAWVEYWQEGMGWQEFDPTSSIASERIEQKIKNKQTLYHNQINYDDALEMSWLQRSQLFFDSVRFFADRWLLFYNQETQRDLLQKIGFGQWSAGQLLQITILCLVLFIIVFGIYYQWSQKQKIDPLLMEYHLLQKEFRRFNVQTHPPATIKQQCMSLTEKAPPLGPTLMAFLNHYEQLRLQQFKGKSRERKKETLLLLKKLRKEIKKNTPSRWATRPFK